MEKYGLERVTVTNAINPSDVWIRLRRKFRNKGFIAILEMNDTSILHPEQRSRLQPGFNYPVYTLAIISVNDLKKIFRAVKRRDIKNPIIFLPPR